jgi:CarboxypepD_reg-like domain
MIIRHFVLPFCLSVLPLLTMSQSLTQTIRGTVVDRVSQTPLPGSSVILLGTDPLVGTTTDPEGNFKLTQVPIGSHTLRITFIGYKELTLPNVMVNSGKEVVLSILLEEDITHLEALVISAETAIEKNKPLNDMAVVSARTFSVEETRKFAAAVNDPARMVSSYAGVVSTSDGNNSISIRGNSPFGLLWRMEGVDIPNPNHFANVATSGGGISILSSQLLANSDFLTGAFPAEFGNALAGVFDLNLRKGNNEKREYTVQAGFLGTDLAAEGPFSKKYRGSYLINYRYSTLSVLSKVGVNIGDAITNFQDLSYNIFLPTKKLGNFSLFGFGGLSDQTQDAKKDSTQWEEEFSRYNSRYFSNTGAAGIKHAITFNTRTYLQSVVVFSGNDNGFEEFRLDDSYEDVFSYRQNHINKKVTASSVLQHKINARHSLRAGVYYNKYFFNLRQRDLNRETNEIEQPLNASGSAQTTQAFTQWNYRVTDRLTLNSGIHFLYLFNTQTYSVEPRASVKYDLPAQQSLSIGYGLHGQLQPIGVYQAETTRVDGTRHQPNKDLEMNKAHHFVTGYDRAVSKHMRIKAETYYQHLYNIAVAADPASTRSTLVNEDGYITDPLVNLGRGRNYGLELTLEHFMHHQLYFLFSASFYQSEYKALDQVWRNTRYNGNHAITFTGGKEYLWKKNRTFGVNIRTIYTGGFRYTPVDITRSQAAGETKYIESLAFTQQLPDYFRTDLRISLKRNRPRSTTTLALDIQNTTNQKNLGGQYFEVRSGEIKKWYQLPLLPILSYRVEF